MSTIPMTIAEVLFTQRAEEDRFLPEGPRDLRVDGRRALAWVNIQTAPNSTSGAIFLRFPDTGEIRYLPQARRPGFLLPTNVPDVVVVGLEKEIGNLSLRTGHFRTSATIPDTNPRTIINDGEIGPEGRTVVFGTKDVRFEGPIAHLYRYDGRSRRINTLADQQLCSNGKIFRCVGEDWLLYDIDTPKRNVMRYRVDTLLERCEPLGVAIDLSSVPGFPDGMVDCGDGTVIIAIYHPTSVDAGHAYRFSLATGELLEGWVLPGAPRVTCPLLWPEEDRVRVIFTTATEGMPEEMRRQCPNAGNLFIADTTLQSVPPNVVVRV